MHWELGRFLMQTNMAILLAPIPSRMLPERTPGLHLPNLGKMGLANILPVDGVQKSANPSASFGRMMEVSQGKDTTTGHWEIVGLILDNPFDVYPDGFPQDLLK